MYHFYLLLTFTDISQIFSTHLFTVLIIYVILHLEQEEQKFPAVQNPQVS